MAPKNGQVRDRLETLAREADDLARRAAELLRAIDGQPRLGACATDLLGVVRHARRIVAVHIPRLEGHDT